MHHLEKYFSLILLKPNLHNKIYEIINKNCAKVIIGTDQWDAGAGCWLLAGQVIMYPINMYEETLKTVMSLVNIQLFPPSMHVFYRSVCIFQTVSEFHSFLYYIIIVSTTFSFRLVRKATHGDKTGHCPPKDGEVQMLLTYTKKLQKEPQSMECGLLTLLISWEK